jgi:very-short-patch-repair endonuclease
METWLRLTLDDAGLPEPTLDHDVYDDDRFLGCVDLAYPDMRIAIEYEGDHHRTDAAQWQRDVEKHDDLVRAGWRVIRVTRTALLTTPATVVARVRHALAVAA